MKKILSTLMALGLVASFGTAYAQSADAVAKACKDKKPGETVKVDGKDVKCPEKKK
jgi:hypothetical protein